MVLRNASGRDALWLKARIAERGQKGVGLAAALRPAFNGSAQVVHRAPHAPPLVGPVQVMWEWTAGQPQSAEVPLTELLAQFAGSKDEALVIELQPGGRVRVFREPAAVLRPTR